MDVLEVAAATYFYSKYFYHYVKILENKKTKKYWKKRRCWMTAVHRNRTRGSMEAQLAELVSEPSGKFNNFTRMSHTDFEFLLNKISPAIMKQNTQLRDAIPPKIRLAITLRYLATGDSFKSLHFLFKISTQLISKIIPEVCVALNEALKDEVKMPSSPEEWLEIEKGFQDKFIRCLGAIDGKRISIRCPSNSAEFHNYKGTFGIVLLGLVDSNYRFIFAEIGSHGRISDGSVFTNSLLWERICSNEIKFPMEHPLPGSNKIVPYVLVGDGAFALSPNVMKPYPGEHLFGSPERTFNNKLSSVRVVVENAFGILSSRFLVFRKPIALDPQKAKVITLTCVLLHNFLRRSKSSSYIYTPEGSFDIYDNNHELVQPGSWRLEIPKSDTFTSLSTVPRSASIHAKDIRDEFTKYFSLLY